MEMEIDIEEFGELRKGPNLEYLGDQSRPPMHVEPVEDIPQVNFDRIHFDQQSVGDLSVAETLHQQFDDFLLTVGQSE